MSNVKKTEEEIMSYMEKFNILSQNLDENLENRKIRAKAISLEEYEAQLKKPGMNVTSEDRMWKK